MANIRDTIEKGLTYLKLKRELENKLSNLCTLKITNQKITHDIFKLLYYDEIYYDIRYTIVRVTPITIEIQFYLYDGSFVDLFTFDLDTDIAYKILNIIKHLDTKLLEIYKLLVKIKKNVTN